MPFSLKNAGATIQRLMDKIMEGLDFVFVYFDDNFISSVDEDEHRHHLWEVFNRLHLTGLTINIGNSEFYKENLDFLDFNISKAGLRPIHKHTKAVCTYPAPGNKEDIAQFTGLVNFFRSCIPKAAQLLQLLKQVFSQLDLVKGYFQVPVHKDNQAKTTVVTPFGTFQFYAIQS